MTKFAKNVQNLFGIVHVEKGFWLLLAYQGPVGGQRGTVDVIFVGCVNTFFQHVAIYYVTPLQLQCCVSWNFALIIGLLMRWIYFMALSP